MKRWKTICVAVLVLVFLTQVPFLYRRLQLGTLTTRIADLTAARSPEGNPRYRDYSGVIHVHTALGGHSRATFAELIDGAQGLDFVVMTEHTDDLFDTAAMTLNGRIAGTLFVGGNEVNTVSDRFLLIPGSGAAFTRRMSETADFLPVFQKQGRLALVTYPETFKSWDSTFDGIEVFNLNTNASQWGGPLFVMQALWSYAAYPELTIATHLTRPDANLHRFDEIAKHRRITLTAGSDAHSNIGYHLFGDDTGNKFLNLKLDAYQTIFRIVRTHLLIDKEQVLSADTLLEALKRGHTYIGFDVLSSTSGFSFSAGTAVMGDEIPLAGVPPLHVSVPLPARTVLFKDGLNVFETRGKELTFQPLERGAYRVEVFLDSLGPPFDRMPWILSNPIYIR